MNADFFDTRTEGALILTANRRLARSLSREHDEVRRRSGLSGWASPRILPFGAWLQSLWSDAVLDGAVTPVLLTTVQEESVWEDIIRKSESGRDLLQPREAAREASEAWALSKQYRVPLGGGWFAGHPDASAFLGWAQEFERLCREREWMPRAASPDAIVGLLEDRLLTLPERAVLCGFDEFTPQQDRLLEAVAAAGCKWVRFVSEKLREVDARRASFADASPEFRAAARWCRDLLEREGMRRIAVVVPNLTSVRDQVERIFVEELDPGALARSAPGRAVFHISAGRPLAKYPIVRAALLFLKLGWPRLPLADAGAVLRSPYLPGANREAASRALLDVDLRRKRQRQVAPSELRRGLSALLERFEIAWKELPRLQSPACWRDSFLRLIEALGWPGEVALSSSEYQSRQAFVSMLDDFASHDLTAQAWDFGQAYDRLEDLAERTDFSIEDEGAPIQVMGVLESAGSQFDALWVTGLHDGAWPQPAHPNPFLPVALQRERNLPHCSSARELQFSRIVTSRLLGAAPRVVLSFPRQEKDAALRASPLIPNLPEWTSTGGEGWPGFLRLRIPLETLIDAIGPAVEKSQAQGGTSILKHQAACPFRAFAQLRLGARTLDEPEPGIGPLDRGLVLHKALELLWRDLESQDRLCATPPAMLLDLARRSVDEAFGTLLRGTRLRAIESERLAGLIVEWMDLERQRAPFRVAGREEAREVEIGGLRIRTRIDRVDELPDGRHIVIDYKATAPSLNAWEGDRPGEPQVPLYASAVTTRVAAAMFANLSPGDLKFVGLSQEEGLIPGVKTDALAGRIIAWRATLDRIGRSYAEGRAEVDPKKGACKNCALTPLCRVREICAAEEETDAAAE
jgi:ATP-dependent helicase/nuclease subunit B